LQVVENWNSANTDLSYGNSGTLGGSDKEHQEVSMLCLHLLQSALVYLLVQSVLKDPAWQKKMTAADRRGLSPLFWSNANLRNHLHPDGLPPRSRPCNLTSAAGSQSPMAISVDGCGVRVGVTGGGLERGHRLDQALPGHGEAAVLPVRAGSGVRSLEHARQGGGRQPDGAHQRVGFRVASGKFWSDITDQRLCAFGGRG